MPSSWKWNTNPMVWIFGRELTPAQRIRKNQRALNKAIRQMDRERAQMESQEKKLIVDIKKMAKDNQNDAVLIMAKDIVRTRKYIKKFMVMKANLQSVAMKLTSLRSQNAMTEAMIGATRVMRQMNTELRMPSIQRILREFEKQSMIAEMKEELLGDAIDDAMGEPEDDEEGDTIVAQIFDELGLQLKTQLSGVPEPRASIAASSKATAKTSAQTSALGSKANLDDLGIQARLDALRRR